MASAQTSVALRDQIQLESPNQILFSVDSVPVVQPALVQASVDKGNWRPALVNQFTKANLKGMTKRYSPTL